MRKLFGKKKSSEQSSEVSLQITSMADIFTILLVFLLKGYATGAMAVTPSKGVRIPAAQGDSLAEEVLQVEISESAIQVGGNATESLNAFKFDEAAQKSPEKLMEALKKESERRALISKANDEVKNDGKILILSDERVPYLTLKTVMKAAVLNGFSDLKLAVIRD